MPFERKGKCVYRKDTGKKKGCSKTVAGAKKYMKALYVHSEDIDKFATPEEKQFLKEYDSSYLSTDYQRGFKDGYDLGWKERDERGER